MFTQILWTHFKWSRAILAAFAVIAFATPSLAWRIGDAGDYGVPGAVAVMMGFSAVGPILIFAAILLGFLLVAHIWNMDGAAKHVYALSLPIPWKSYVTMRFGAGALSLLVPTAALWLGALLAISLVEVPASLNAYPGTLALRFLLGALLAYALSFLLQYLAGRRAPVVLLTLLVSGVAVPLALSLFGYEALVTSIGRVLTEWPGPLAVFATEWRLIDV